MVNSVAYPTIVLANPAKPYASAPTLPTMNGVMTKPMPILTAKFTNEATRLMMNCLFLLIYIVVGKINHVDIHCS